MIFKKILSILLSVSLIFLVFNNVVVANGNEDSNEYNFEVIQKDDKLVRVKAEKDGDQLFATLDKETNEITLEAIEQKQNFLSKMGVTSSVYSYSEFKVDAETIDGDIVDAIIIDVDTGEEFKLEQGTDSVQAQWIGVLIPVIEWAGSALLAFLASHALSITVAGIIAYSINDLINDIKKQKNYNYWAAWLRDGDIYLNPAAFPNDSAAFAYLNTGNSKDINLFAKTSAKSEQAAKKVTGYAKYNQAHGANDGYYEHYHPVERTGEQFSNHVWFYPGT